MFMLNLEELEVRIVLIHCLLEPGVPCIKPMGIRIFSSQRVNNAFLGSSRVHRTVRVAWPRPSACGDPGY